MDFNDLNQIKSRYNETDVIWIYSAARLCVSCLQNVCLYST